MIGQKVQPLLPFSSIRSKGRRGEKLLYPSHYQKKGKEREKKTYSALKRGTLPQEKREEPVS